MWSSLRQRVKKRVWGIPLLELPMCLLHLWPHDYSRLSFIGSLQLPKDPHWFRLSRVCHFKTVSLLSLSIVFASLNKTITTMHILSNESYLTTFFPPKGFYYYNAMHDFNLEKQNEKNLEDDSMSMLPLVWVPNSKKAENPSDVRAPSEHKLSVLFTIPFESPYMLFIIRTNGYLGPSWSCQIHFTYVQVLT